MRCRRSICPLKPPSFEIRVFPWPQAWCSPQSRRLCRHTDRFWRGCTLRVGVARRVSLRTQGNIPTPWRWKRGWKAGDRVLEPSACRGSFASNGVDLWQEPPVLQAPAWPQRQEVSCQDPPPDQVPPEASLPRSQQISVRARPRASAFLR